jgi:hypothetical protein
MVTRQVETETKAKSE